jgi:uncharacterized membrane protein
VAEASANAGAGPQPQPQGQQQNKKSQQQSFQDLTASMTPRTAALLCYIPVVGWVPSLVVLASARFRENRIVRFHAFQGLYLFVAWLIVDWFFEPFFSALPGMSSHRMLFVKLLQAAILGCWILMLVKVNKDEHYRLPLVGDLAEKSVSEQG